jgi:hypothetical protein
MFLLAWTRIWSDKKGRNVCSLFTEYSTKVVLTAEMWFSLYCVPCLVLKHVKTFHTGQNIAWYFGPRVTQHRSVCSVVTKVTTRKRGKENTSSFSATKCQDVQTGRLSCGLSFWNAPNFKCTQSTNVCLVNILFPLQIARYAHSTKTERYAQSITAEPYAHSRKTAFYAYSIRYILGQEY